MSRHVKIILGLVALTGAIATWAYFDGVGTAQSADVIRIASFGRALETIASSEDMVANGEYKMPTNLPDAVRLLKENHAGGSDLMLPAFEDNRTPWGGSYVYICDHNGRRAIIRSTGQNRRDDSGGGDDVQYIIDLDRLAASRGTVAPPAAPTVKTISPASDRPQ